MSSKFAVLAAALVFSLTLAGCDSVEEGYRQPTIDLGSEEWLDSSQTNSPSEPVPEEEVSEEDESGLNLPSRDDFLAGGASEASDLSMSLVSRYLSYSFRESPKSIVNELRNYASTDLLDKLGVELRERDWESVVANEESRIADVTSVEIVEYDRDIPRAVIVQVSLFEESEGESEELGSSRWRVIIAPDSFSNSLIAVDLIQE